MISTSLYYSASSMRATIKASVSHVSHAQPNIPPTLTNSIQGDDVAELMGPKFSGGAIVQHLAKLRVKMVEADMKPLPPPLKKGMTTTAPSSLYAPNKKRKASVAATRASASAADDDGAGAAPTAPTTTTRRAKPKSKATKVKKEDSDSDSDEIDLPEDQDSDSDGEFGASKPQAKKAKTKPASQGAKYSAATPSPKAIKTDESDNDGHSPSMNTRGRRLNYAEMMNPVDNEDNDEDDADDDGNEKLATPTPAAMSGLPVSTPSPMPPRTPSDSIIKARTPATPRRGGNAAASSTATAGFTAASPSIRPGGSAAAIQNGNLNAPAAAAAAARSSYVESSYGGAATGLGTQRVSSSSFPV